MTPMGSGVVLLGPPGSLTGPRRSTFILLDEDRLHPRPLYRGTVFPVGFAWMQRALSGEG
jgi:hypothetical protein